MLMESTTNKSNYLILIIILLISIISFSFYNQYLRNSISFKQSPKINPSKDFQRCKHNPFLKFYNQQMIDDYESKWKNWSQNHFTNTFTYLKKYAQSSGKIVGEFSQIVYPSMPFLPCSSLKRYGNSRDAGKQLCGLENLLPTDNCIVYSLGSNNDFQFENSVLSETSCLIHTFDCTSSPPKQKNERLIFHKICLGEKSSLQEYIYPYSKKKLELSVLVNNFFNKFMKFDQIIQMNKHQRIHVLKMDIEGGEYSVFADILENSNRLELPFQVSFESHWWNRDIYHSILHMSLFSQLFRSGYRLLQYELNDGDPSCIEWTFLRVFC